MRFDKVPNDGQTKPKAALSPFNSLLSLPEPVEHMP
jgi:hypothetical protein